MEDIKFSIIIPVYNAEKYLDRCLDSVEKQTYSNWEMIIVNDGSLDDSLAIGKSHAERDVRIRLFSKENEGQGIARNEALKRASGDYVIFVDSDDWIEQNYLEECYKAIIKYNPDIILFFMKVWESEKQTVSKKLIIDEIIDDETKMGDLLRVTDFIPRVHKRSLLLENNISFGHGKYEDTYLICLPVLYAKKVVQLKKILYNYDRRNSFSTTHESKYDSQLIEKLGELAITISQRNLLKKSKTILDLFVLILLKGKLNEIPKESRVLYLEECDNLLKKRYPMAYSISHKKILVWGSYTLRSAVNNLMLDLNNVTHFQFSSLIAAVSEKSNLEFCHANAYRESMVKAELQAEFWSAIKEGLIKQYDYIVVDFLEERYDIYRTLDGYITVSDAYESGKCNIKPESKLLRTEKKVEELWKKKCMQLINALKPFMPGKKIILVKNFLCEGFGEFFVENDFETVSWIKQINVVLSGYYEYIENEFKDITVIELPNRHNFTDVHYKHGCFPWHTNEARELDVSMELLRILKE